MNSYLMELSHLSRRFFRAFFSEIKEEMPEIWIAAPAIMANILLLRFRPKLQSIITSRLNLLAKKAEEQVLMDKKEYEDNLRHPFEAGDWYNLLLKAIIDANTSIGNMEKILEFGKWCLEVNPLQATKAFEAIHDEQSLRRVFFKLLRAHCRFPHFEAVVEIYLYFARQNVSIASPNKILRLAGKIFVAEDSLNGFLKLLKDVTKSCESRKRRLSRKIIQAMAKKYMAGGNAKIATGLLRIIGEKPRLDQIAIMAENNLKKGHYYSALRLYKKLGRVREGKRKVLEAELENKGHSYWRTTESPHGFEKTFMMSMRKGDIVQTAQEMAAKSKRPCKLLKYLYAVGDIDSARKILFPSSFSEICPEKRAANSYCGYLDLLEKKIRNC